MAEAVGVAADILQPKFYNYADIQLLIVRRTLTKSSYRKALSWAEFSEEVAPGTIRHRWRGEGRRIISLRGRTFQ